MLSTTLYIAIIVIENIAGSDIVRMSGSIGFVPILFSVLTSLLMLHLLPSDSLIYKIKQQHYRGA